MAGRPWRRRRRSWRRRAPPPPAEARKLDFSAIFINYLSVCDMYKLEMTSYLIYDLADLTRLTKFKYFVKIRPASPRPVLFIKARSAFGFISKRATRSQLQSLDNVPRQKKERTGGKAPTFERWNSSNMKRAGSVQFLPFQKTNIHKSTNTMQQTTGVELSHLFQADSLNGNTKSGHNVTYR